MRRYKRTAVMAVFLGLLLWRSLPTLTAYALAWFENLKTANPRTLSDTAETSLVYLAQPRRWLGFRIPNNSRQIRIISTAHIIRPDKYALDPNWDYSLNYELQDNEGRILKKGLYRLRAGLSTYKDSGGQISYDNYYATDKVQPLDSLAILFNLQGFDKAALLRIGLGPSNPEIMELALRVYTPSNPSDPDLATSWLRMNPMQREKLADRLIYPSFLLSDSEIQKLLENQWQPLGPEGLAGLDYQKRILYTLKNRENSRADEALLLAQGLQADARHTGVIPIPEGGGNLELHLKTLDGSPPTSPIALDLEWFGRDLKQRWRQQTVWEQTTERLQYPLDGGLLVIKPSAPALILAYLSTATEPKHDISDALLSVKAYPAHAEIDYAVLHYRDLPTHLRVTVRRLMARGATPVPTTVHYQFLDDRQQTLSAGELAAPTVPSLFDRMGDIIENIDVSDPANAYFRLPAKVARLRLTASDPSLLVSAYNQPDGFVKRDQIPEDDFYGGDQKILSQAWFPLRAVNDRQLTLSGNVQWISGQARPPQDDPELLADRYLWEDYIPRGNRPGRYFLTDYDNPTVRPEALATVYCQIPANRELSSQIEALPGLSGISPELLVLRDNNHPFTVKISLNGEKALAAAGIGLQSLFRLPEIQPSRYHLRLESDDRSGQWLLNYQGQCPGKRYLKRRAFALETGAGLEFVVPHAAAGEILSARWYTPPDHAGRAQLKVSIAAVQSTDTVGFAGSTVWTHNNRLFDIRPLSAPPMPVLYSQGQTLGNGERFAIPINSDLPPGDYRIRITLAKGGPGYLSLSQTRPGLHGGRRFFKEAVHEIN